MNNIEAVVRFLLNRIVEDGEEAEGGERGEGVDVRELREEIVSENEGFQLWERLLELGGDARDPIVAHKERGEAIQERKALELLDFIVGEVEDVVLILRGVSAARSERDG